MIYSPLDAARRVLQTHIDNMSAQIHSDEMILGYCSGVVYSEEDMSEPVLISERAALVLVRDRLAFATDAREKLEAALARLESFIK